MKLSIDMWAKLKVKKVKATCSSWVIPRQSAGRHMPYGITQFYLPPDTRERAPHASLG